MEDRERGELRETRRQREREEREREKEKERERGEKFASVLFCHA